MELILDGLDVVLLHRCVMFVVRAALLEDVGDLYIKAPFAGANLPNPLKQLLEVIRTELLALLQPLVVQHEAFDDELSKRTCGPDSELSRLEAIHPVPDGDYHIEVVEINIPLNLPATLLL